jgi:hypothetical protein
MPPKVPSNPFPVGNKIAKKNVGVKHKATQVKQTIGTDGWQKLAEYINKEGAEKYIETVHAIKGKDFLTAYTSLAEYFKPKLARQEVKMEVSQITINWEKP